MDARIHTCPTCKKTYTGIVCSPCFAKASSSDRHGFFRGLIKNDPTEIKIKKFHDYYHNFNQDLKDREREELMESLKDELYEEFKQRQLGDPRLRLFKVTVHVTSGPGGPNGFRTYVLDVDGPSAENAVLEAVGRKRVHPDKMVYTDEVKGPFGAGDIIVWDEF